jgi:hypothetical protein
VQGVAELGDDMATSRLEMFSQQRPRRVAEPVRTGAVMSAVEAADDPIWALPATSVNSLVELFTPASTIGRGSSSLASVSA